MLVVAYACPRTAVVCQVIPSCNREQPGQLNIQNKNPCAPGQIMTLSMHEERTLRQTTCAKTQLPQANDPLLLAHISTEHKKKKKKHFKFGNIIYCASTTENNVYERTIMTMKSSARFLLSIAHVCRSGIMKTWAKTPTAPCVQKPIVAGVSLKQVPWLIRDYVSPRSNLQRAENDHGGYLGVRFNEQIGLLPRGSLYTQAIIE